MDVDKTAEEVQKIIELNNTMDLPLDFLTTQKGWKTSSDGRLISPRKRGEETIVERVCVNYLCFEWDYAVKDD